MMPNNVRLADDNTAVIIIDQTRLPLYEEYLTLKSEEDFCEAIYMLKVRGAPAIGICAGFAMYVLALQLSKESKDVFFNELQRVKLHLLSTRPTAVNLQHALSIMEDTALLHKNKSFDEILAAMLQRAIKIQQDDISMCKAISQYGLTLVKNNDGILTHCNAGPLATSLYGTGLGTLLLGKEKGYNFHAFVDETRPLLQGARLTSYELYNAGIDVTLICDNMASIVMKEGKINACFVGCDRVAANGDTANKIGTSGVAILAKYYNVPFYVFCPSSTIDFNAKTGKDITIELRDSEEIKTKFFSEPVALKGINCYNPAFDVTEGTLISAIITENGICRYPYTESIKTLLLKEG